MSNELQNNMSPVMAATPEIQQISEQSEIKFAAIDALYRKHYEHKIHAFTEAHREKHVAYWKVTQYAEEQVAYGTNYFLKVAIDDGLFIHIRIHQHKNQNKFNFYALHEIIRHNAATCVFTDDEPLTYFNY
ncbi:unnamed protein product [Adineta ricciae]|uniref:Uncharacterized protein n=1 Tax=Adineta ricciae TaxID=249248 RepID=A0A813V974_ADIRI|nr:unnamed protein product [Adineta ricciae]CAF0994133.1 unnamed protein product [Adineta ricciae]CAF1057229.1 unnamed protein product [Adineta ricciae]